MRKLKTGAKIGIILAVVLIIAALGTLYIVSSNQSANNQTSDTTELPVQNTEYHPVVYATQDAFMRYLQELSNNSIVNQEHIHTTQDIDWNEQAILAVQFSLPTSHSYRSVSVEQVEGRDTVIVDVLGAAKGCYYVQVNHEHVAFVRIDQADTDKVYGVVLRITPNEASCEF